MSVFCPDEWRQAVVDYAVTDSHDDAQKVAFSLLSGMRLTSRNLLESFASPSWHKCLNAVGNSLLITRLMKKRSEAMQTLRTGCSKADPQINTQTGVILRSLAHSVLTNWRFLLWTHAQRASMLYFANVFYRFFLCPP